MSATEEERSFWQHKINMLNDEQIVVSLSIELVRMRLEHEQRTIDHYRFAREYDLLEKQYQMELRDVGDVDGDKPWQVTNRRMKDLIAGQFAKMTATPMDKEIEKVRDVGE